MALGAGCFFFSLRLLLFLSFVGWLEGVEEKFSVLLKIGKFLRLIKCN